MVLDKTTVSRIARLAQLGVPEETQDAMATELSDILDWVEQLKEVDTSGVAPMTSAVEVGARRRGDSITEANRRDEVLSTAPEASDGFFAVPKVIE